MSAGAEGSRSAALSRLRAAQCRVPSVRAQAPGHGVGPGADGGPAGAAHARGQGGQAWMEAGVGERAAFCGGNMLMLHPEVTETRVCGHCF